MLAGDLELVRDINAFSQGSDPQEFVQVGDLVYFTALTPELGGRREIWKSDGTPGGTVHLPSQPRFDRTPTHLTSHGGRLFFTLRGSTGPTTELWTTDGTEVGTTKLTSIATGINDFNSWASVGDLLYFRANDGVAGYELWKTDGTAAGTGLVKDVNPGFQTSEVGLLTEHAGGIVFSAYDPVRGRTLWKTDGTEAGTIVVKQFGAANSGHSIDQIDNVNGVLYVAARGPVDGGVWRSDGTTAGTTRLASVNIGPTAGIGESFQARGAEVFFSAESLVPDGSQGWQLWKTNGTAAGTSRVTNFPTYGLLLRAARVANITVVGQTVFFTVNTFQEGAELWKSDGTLPGTSLVRDLKAGPLGSDPRSLVNLAGTLYFVAGDGGSFSSAAEVWRSDGTSDGTTLVQLSAERDEPLRTASLTKARGQLYFSAASQISGVEPWRLAPGDTHPTIVRDIQSDSPGSSAENLTVVGDKVFFTANDGATGVELWVSGGSTAGTRLVTDVFPGADNFGVPNSSNPSSLVNVNGVLYFAARESLTSRSLWRTDGTSAGTYRVTAPDASAQPTVNDPIELINVGGTIYFIAADGFADALWKSDGTAAGTLPVRRFDAANTVRDIRSLTDAGGTLFFFANDGVTGYELWKSDGSTAGTVLVKDVQPGADGSADQRRDRATGDPSLFLLLSSSESITALGNRVVFFPYDGVSGREPWVSDGTESGTFRLRDIYAGPNSSVAAPERVVVGDTLYFAASDGGRGLELYRTDGTSEGTRLAQDIIPGLGDSSPGSMRNVDGTLVFLATGPSSLPASLFRGLPGQQGVSAIVSADSANAGFRLFAESGSPLFYATVKLAQTGASVDLWWTDGTASGAQKVELPEGARAYLRTWFC
jgi:ELWxxDGT repeat protein